MEPQTTHLLIFCSLILLSIYAMSKLLITSLGILDVSTLSSRHLAEMEDVLKLLHEKVVELMLKRGFSQLTPVQRPAIPKVLEGKNVLIIAPTGSGKTEAALLPILSVLRRLKDEGKLEKGIYVLYISPLRSLNRDLLERLRWWCENLGLKIDVRHGDTDIRDRARQSRDPPHILITTPEMLQAILLGRRLREHLSKLCFVIVDEIHELVEDKRGVQLVVTLERLRNLLGRDFQVIGLSATVGEPEKVAKFLVGHSRDCEIVQVSHVREMVLDVVFPQPEDVDMEVARKICATPDVAARLRYILQLVDREGPAIIFVNTRSMAENLAARFNAWLPDYPIAVHHSSLSKTVREGIEKMLREGKLKAVIATSSLELGIDIGHINIVIQYTSPHQVTRLVQRVGRSGHRPDKVPRGIIVVHDVYDALEAAVIVNKARQGYLEPVKIPEKPYDVMCNQIVACILTKPRWTVDELYEVFSKAYPYHSLTREELEKVLEYMSDELYPPLVFYGRERRIVERPRARRARKEVYKYFTSNLSMIPEEKQYAVINARTGEFIGVLDEAFVAEYAQPGVKFVFRGKVWIIVDVTRNKALVEEARDVIGAIPAWIGEEIPVPFEIAVEVGRILRIVEELHKNGATFEDIVQDLAQMLKISRDTVSIIVKRVLEHIRAGTPVPAHDRIVIENIGNLNVIHATFGTLVNRTLSKLLAEYITKSYNTSVREYSDPYAIVLETSIGLSGECMRDVLTKLANMSDNELEQLLAETIFKSGTFKRRFIHVARRFNAIPKDADLSSASLASIIEAFKGTPVLEEAVKEYLEKDMDFQTALKILRMIRDARIEILIVKRQEPSPLAREILDRLSGKVELTGPEGHKMIMHLSFRSRVLNELVTLVCLDCLWSKTTVVREIPDEVRCERCGSKHVGVLKLPEEKAQKMLEKLRQGTRLEEVRKLQTMLETTSLLVSKYGKLAVIAMCTKIPPEMLEELLDKLSKQASGLDDFIEKLFEAEREFVKSYLVK